MSDLLKLNNIVQRSGDIKAFPLSSNMKSAKHGKGPWGEVTIAIDGESVERLWGNDVVGILYIIGKDEWERECKPNKSEGEDIKKQVSEELAKKYERTKQYKELKENYSIDSDTVIKE